MTPTPTLTRSLALAEPAPPFKFTKDGQEKQGWNLITVDHKAKFVCFDAALVAQIEKAQLVNVEHEYTLKETAKGLMIVGIPGVYEAAKGRSNGFRGPSGPLLTDRQVALAAAVGFTGHAQTDEFVLARAENFLAWLKR